MAFLSALAFSALTSIASGVVAILTEFKAEVVFGVLLLLVLLFAGSAVERLLVLSIVAASVAFGAVFALKHPAFAKLFDWLL